MKRCPPTYDRISFQIFDGRTCVQPLQVFTCPQPNGSFRYLNYKSQYFECIDSRPIPRKCLENNVFDGQRCVQQTLPAVSSSAVKPEFTCPLEIGLFSNPLDPRNLTYYECYNSYPIKKKCPSFVTARDGQNYRKRTVFDGRTCVKPRLCPKLTKISHNEDNLLRFKRQAGSGAYRCTTEGIQKSITEPRTWYECTCSFLRVYKCKPGQTLDMDTKLCIDINPTQPPPPNLSDRRARFEIEDSGSNTICTWHERLYRWQCTYNHDEKDLVLPDVYQDSVGTRRRGHYMSSQPVFEYRD